MLEYASYTGGNVWIGKQGAKCQIASVTTKETTVKEVSCQGSYFPFCEIPWDTKYYFVGYYPEIVEFSLRSYSQPAVFDAVSPISIQLNTYLEQINTDTKLTIAKSVDKVKPMDILGRREWNNPIENIKVPVAFTACKSNQYSCDNGLCIPLTQICDYKAHCPDYTDEDHCNVTMKRPDYYDKSLSGKEDIKVDAEITLSRIVDISMTDGTVSLEIYIITHWIDERVTFVNLHKGVETIVSDADSKYYWKPLILLDGVINDDIETFAFPYKPGKMFLKSINDGIVTYIKSKKGNFLFYKLPKFLFAWC